MFVRHIKLDSYLLVVLRRVCYGYPPIDFQPVFRPDWAEKSTSRDQNQSPMDSCQWSPIQELSYARRDIYI